MVWLLKIKGYLIALGSLLLALIGTYLWAKHAGKSQGSEDQKAADAQAAADAIKQQVDTRTDVEMQVNDLPKPKFDVHVPPDLPIPPSEGAQQVGTADPATAAGKLHDWMRQD
jgi:hypothetical protein